MATSPHAPLTGPEALAALAGALACDAAAYTRPVAPTPQGALFGSPPASEPSAEGELTLALARAVNEVAWGGDAPHHDAGDRLRNAFASWRQSPAHHRHPGITVSGAAGALCGQGPWFAAAIPASRGSSPVARCVPFAFVPENSWAGAAQRQAAMTHANPTVVASAHLATATLRWALGGGARSGALAHLHDLVQRERSLYREAWLERVWERGRADTASAWITRGWDAVGRQLIALADELGALLAAPRVHDNARDLLTADVALIEALRWWLSGPPRTAADALALAAEGTVGSSAGMLCGALVGGTTGDAAAFHVDQLACARALQELCVEP